MDGNKRAAFLAVGLFLGLNDFRLAADQVDAARNVLALAAGEINEEQFATGAWQYLENTRETLRRARGCDPRRTPAKPSSGGAPRVP